MDDDGEAFLGDAITEQWCAGRLAFLTQRGGNVNGTKSGGWFVFVCQDRSKGPS
jgi:hypothetical protein